MIGEFTVAVGGSEQEVVFSHGSAAWMQERLEALGIECIIEIYSNLEEFSDRLDAARKYVLLFHGGWGEGGDAQEVLERRGVQFSGSRSRASRLCLDKFTAKECVRRLGIEVPRTIRSGDIDYEIEDIVVKPRYGGSSVNVGVFPRHDLDTEYDEEIVLREEFIEGTIATIAIADRDGLTPVNSSVCITPVGEAFYSERVKNKSDREIVPAKDMISTDSIRRLEAAAWQAYVGLGCSGVARADFIVRGNGAPVFLEMNTIPGLGEKSNALACYRAAGLGSNELVWDILRSVR